MKKISRTYLIAVDFDGCICSGGFPNIENAVLIESTVEKIIKQRVKNINTDFILWTCRAGEKLSDAIEFCKKHQLPIYYYNEQHPSTFGWMHDAADVRKIFAHEYWDDRSVYVGQKCD